MSESLERRLEEALTEQAQAFVPSGRTPPVIDFAAVAAESAVGPATSPRALSWARRWRTPVFLGAAASVAVGAFAVSAISDGAPTPVAQVPAPTASSATVTAAPTATASPRGRDAVQVSSARIGLPKGWAAWTPAKASRTRSVCVGPEGSPKASCPVVIAEVDPTESLANPAVPGAVEAASPFALPQPPVCPPAAPTARASKIADDEAYFGSRVAESNTWEVTCRDGSTVKVAQVMTQFAPAFIAYTTDATTENRAALAEIARTSQLPAATSSLPLSDSGVVAGVLQTADGTVIQIVASEPAGLGSTPGPTVTYSVPLDALVGSASSATATPQVGDQATVLTDGSTVKELTVEPETAGPEATPSPGDAGGPEPEPNPPVEPTPKTTPTKAP